MTRTFFQSTLPARIPTSSEGEFRLLHVFADTGRCCSFSSEPIWRICSSISFWF